MNYTLVISNGAVLEETGHFFKALPFSIIVAGHQESGTTSRSPSSPAPRTPSPDLSSRTETFAVKFERGSSGKVVFKIMVEKTVLAECHHPDYIPELSELFKPSRPSSKKTAPGMLPPPEALPTRLYPVIHAFTHLNITRDKNYLAYFHPLTGTKTPKPSFKVIQRVSYEATFSKAVHTGDSAQPAPE